MATKAEIADEITEITGEPIEAGEYSKEELEAKLHEIKGNLDPVAETEDKLEQLRQPGGVTRRKVNRGSTRRLHRALEEAEKALAEFEKEVDLQAYVTDDEGNRVDDLPLVHAVREARQLFRDGINEITNPA
jgi:cell fate (sporulation/competence/biofilm development) regulator YlbF (YheA/YmcA/DUF963 family)